MIVYVIVAILAVSGLFLLSNLFGNLVYVLLMKVFKIPMNILVAYSWVAEIVVAGLLILVFYGIYKAVFGGEDSVMSEHRLSDLEIVRESSVSGVLKTASGKAGFSGKLSLMSLIIGAGVSGISFIWVTLAAQIPFFEKSLKSMDENNAGMGGGGMLYLFLSAAVVAPLLEEIIFRGLVFRCLNKVKAGLAAIILSAIIFGLYHMNAAQAVYTTGMGIIAAIVYTRTGNLLYPILVHMMNNLIGVFQSALPESGILVSNIITVIMIVPTLYILVKWLKGEAGKKYGKVA